MPNVFLGKMPVIESGKSWVRLGGPLTGLDMSPTSVMARGHGGGWEKPRLT